MHFYYRDWCESHHRIIANKFQKQYISDQPRQNKIHIRETEKNVEQVKILAE